MLVLLISHRDEWGVSRDQASAETRELGHGGTGLVRELLCPPKTLSRMAVRMGVW
jgi:hypothetical protein